MPKNPSALSNLIKSKPVPEKVDKKVVSHSQFTVYNSCPYQWKLRYIDKMKPFTSTINTVFGTAMHETLQTYLSTMYGQSIKAADSINLEELLLEKLKEIYSKELLKNEGNDFTTPDEFFEFYGDGLEILRWFKGHRAKFFSIKGWELLGVEIPIMMPTEDNPNVFLNCFLDLVLGDKTEEGKIRKVYIYDFKTSKNGWGDKEKKDKAKIAQGLLYKRYFAKQYEIPEDDIEVIFLVLRRKIWENAEFPIPRVSAFRPACGKGKVNEASFMLKEFVDACFTDEGEYNIERRYQKNPSQWNCRYCSFNNNFSVCDQRRG